MIINDFFLFFFSMHGTAPFLSGNATSLQLKWRGFLLCSMKIQLMPDPLSSRRVFVGGLQFKQEVKNGNRDFDFFLILVNFNKKREFILLDCNIL